MINKIFLRKGREESIKRFHPWVFSGAIDKVEGSVTDGDLVELYDWKGEYLATGHAATGSIAVKIYLFAPEKHTSDIWLKKLKKAYALRERLGYTNSADSNAYRLVFSEADGLPGVIIDYYNGVAVIQLHSQGMELIKNELAEAVKQLYGDKLIAVYNKSKETLLKSGIKSDDDSFLYNSSDAHTILENGHSFLINFIEGQKTGFFLDQRDNRALLSRYVTGKKVLNAFCYTGGFSIYALMAGANHVTSLDSSQKAMDALELNLALNPGYKGSHKGVVADAKEWLGTMENDYEVIVLDPPAFAKRQADKHRALSGYKYINQTAISKIKKGGILFTFSCSQAISNEQFTSIIMAAAIEAGRDVKILHHIGHSPDHPVSIFHPEGEYLKGLVVMVD